MKLILAAVLLIVSITGSIANAAPLNEKAMLKQYDLLKLNDAAILLMGAVDSKKPEAEFCNIPSATAVSYTETIHALIDSKLDEYIRLHAKKPSYSEGTWAKCAATCACGIEASILDKVGFAKINDADKKIYREIADLAMEQDVKEIRACATKSKWFCTSDLLKYAKQEAIH
jgi:hypothetical protein